MRSWRVSRRTVVPLLALLLPGCAGSPRIQVGAKNFTEQTILGEIAAQQIERRLGVPVRRRLNLGSTFLAHLALLNGQVDLYPEYTGTALTAILKRQPAGDAAVTRGQINAAYQQRFRARWMPPLGFDNTFAMVVRGAQARTQGLHTLSDAARAPAAWRLGVGYEFQLRPDGWKAVRDRYGLRAASVQSMDLGLLYQALQGGQVDMVAANATDGALATLDVRHLEDDRHAFPPYEAAFVVREDALARYPALAAALAELSGRLDAALMRRLNHAVDGQKRPARAVAAEFLRSLERPRETLH